MMVRALGIVGPPSYADHSRWRFVCLFVRSPCVAGKIHKADYFNRLVPIHRVCDCLAIKIDDCGLIVGTICNKPMIFLDRHFHPPITIAIAPAQMVIRLIAMIFLLNVIVFAMLYI